MSTRRIIVLALVAMFVLFLAANMSMAAPPAQGDGPMATPGLDADKVDGFDAINVPTINTILPLDGEARYPLSVMPRNLWLTTGNAGLSGNNYLGTSDLKALDFRVNGKRAFRLEPGTSPNVVGGYNSNSVTAGAIGATIGGGGAASSANKVSDNFGTIGGGTKNQAGDNAGTTSDHAYGTVGGGFLNKATGSYSTVAGGSSNVAAGDYSFAAGRRAKVGGANDGSFLFADGSDFDFNSAADNEFAVRATGGARFISGIDGSGAATHGVVLAAGADSWASLGTLEAKTDFAPVDARNVLEVLAKLPIQSWSYADQDASIRHIGPAAQDFHAAFGVGESDQSISTADVDGVTLAALQGLYQASQEKDAQIAALQQKNVELEARLTALELASVNRPATSSLPLGGVLLGGTAVAGLAFWQKRRTA